jgi:putative SOS response-associated peptidase YedK
MCSHYQAIKDRERYLRSFGVPPPEHPYIEDVWPGYAGSFIRRPAEADSGDEAVPAREALAGLFGLLPHWARDTKLSRSTYNARSETVAEKPSFRDAWRRGRHCIVPLEAFYEPDWRSGRPVPARISLADGQPMGLAGLWDQWRSSEGMVVHSFTMLTINADAHPFMREFHKPGEEKRMVVVLAPQVWDDWLKAPAEASMSYLQPWPADQLQSLSQPPKPKAARKEPPPGLF